MQDYNEAARVRDFISIVVSQDPILSTREALERAISEERYDVSKPAMEPTLTILRARRSISASFIPSISGYIHLLFGGEDAPTNCKQAVHSRDAAGSQASTSNGGLHKKCDLRNM